MSSSLPKRGVALIVNTPFCSPKFPASVCYFNGVDFISIEGSKVMNVSEYCYLEEVIKTVKFKIMS